MTVMDKIVYVCFCRSIFSSLDKLRTHKLYCDHFKNTCNKNPKFDNPPLMTTPESQVLENSSELIGLIKSDFAFLKEDEESSGISNENIATNFWGRRLPRRTKVPYLSRAVPLSIDHSYERCQCGAVFVTTLGKRQHQARFCKIIKSKSGKPIAREDIKSESEKFQAKKTESIRNKPVKFIIMKQLPDLKTYKGVDMERRN